MKLVLDTNFLISMVNFHISLSEALDCIESGAEPVILGASMAELEKLINEGNSTERKSAKLALSVAKANKIKVIAPETGYVDDLLLGLDPKEYIVATQDNELKRRLKQKGFKLVVIRQKKYTKVE
ncbi:MAG: hypothetical protein Q8L34_04825 [Candidatus Woesearchaeota archaeon]|nr:hypothetical protein [Candidatus Woesearchaeota archaeon]